ncbi:hypothetical protein BV20DRAFT_982656 [Pilatotrama ljubarskyi]|nr:hypothetical protein BV20DRAFT_982656 [Pilatotrama ljubarskyi]
MSLNAAVDTPLSGVGAFWQVFLSEDYLDRLPERAKQVEKLRHAIDEQVQLIDRCFKLHGQFCPPEMLAFRATLEKLLPKNITEEWLSVDSFQWTQYLGLPAYLQLPRCHCPTT